MKATNNKCVIELSYATSNSFVAFPDEAPSAQKQIAKVKIDKPIFTL